jgi:hypothetical protein
MLARASAPQAPSPGAPIPSPADATPAFGRPASASPASASPASASPASASPASSSPGGEDPGPGLGAESPRSPPSTLARSPTSRSAPPSVTSNRPSHGERRTAPRSPTEGPERGDAATPQTSDGALANRTSQPQDRTDPTRQPTRIAQAPRAPAQAAVTPSASSPATAPSVAPRAQTALPPASAGPAHGHAPLARAAAGTAPRRTPIAAGHAPPARVRPVKPVPTPPARPILRRGRRPVPPDPAGVGPAVSASPQQSDRAASSPTSVARSAPVRLNRTAGRAVSVDSAAPDRVASVAEAPPSTVAYASPPGPAPLHDRNLRSDVASRPAVAAGASGGARGRRKGSSPRDGFTRTVVDALRRGDTAARRAHTEAAARGPAVPQPGPAVPQPGSSPLVAAPAGQLGRVRPAVMLAPRVAAHRRKSFSSSPQITSHGAAEARLTGNDREQAPTSTPPHDPMPLLPGSPDAPAASATPATPPVPQKVAHSPKTATPAVLAQVARSPKTATAVRPERPRGAALAPAATRATAQPAAPDHSPRATAPFRPPVSPSGSLMVARETAGSSSSGGGGGGGGAGQDSDLIYAEVMGRVRAEQEQLGQLITHPF